LVETQFATAGRSRSRAPITADTTLSAAPWQYGFRHGSRGALRGGHAAREPPGAASAGTERGIVEGRDKLRDFLHIVFERTPPSRRRYRTGFFTDGRRLIWEYPRETPDGDQMDFVESMEIENGLIRRHSVYWGWFGVQVLEGDRYHR
jgi:hypothetical protein